jgi:very-short-patch-repair endonuclease
MSELEERLDAELKLMVRAKLLPAYVREFGFTIEGRKKPWRADFAWPEYKLMVEVDGGEFVQGRHNRGGPRYQDDLRKGNRAAILGYTVLHFSTGMMDEAITTIEEWFKARSLTG